jgi:hypothetical protein
MAIIPTVRCTRMANSIAFYTKVLDFDCVDGDADEGDPSFAILVRKPTRSSCQVMPETASSDRLSPWWSMMLMHCFTGSERED